MIENYVKMQLQKNNITLKDASNVLGYQENSFYNKICRHSLNINDLIFIAEMIGQKITFQNDNGEITYTFNPSEYLKEDDFLRLAEFKSKRKNINFSEMSLKDLKLYYNNYIDTTKYPTFSCWIESLE